MRVEWCNNTAIAIALPHLLLCLVPGAGARCAPYRLPGAEFPRYRHRAGTANSGRPGRPVLADGRTLGPATVLWATGFDPDYAWIRLRVSIFREDGYPQYRRGVVEEEPGLYRKVIS